MSINPNGINSSDMDLPDGIGMEPATPSEIMAAYERGRNARADFVMLCRETDDDGTIDETTMMIFCPAESDQRNLWEKLTEKGMAIRCSPLTRREKQQLLTDRRQWEAQAKDTERLHKWAQEGHNL